MATGEAFSPEGSEVADLRSSARRTLDFERRYLRRRWAAFYAVWTLAFVVFLAVPRLVGSALDDWVGTFGALATFATLDVAVIALAVPVCLVLFHRGDRTYELRGAVAGGRAATGSEALLRVAIVAVAVVGLLVSGVLFGLGSFWTVVVPVYVFLFLSYRNLARSFRPIPVEGWVALASFFVANTLTVLLPWSSLFTAIAVLAWSIALGVWAVIAGSAWYVLAPAPEEYG